MSAISEVVDEIDNKIEYIRRKVSAASEEDPLVSNNWVGSSMSLDQLGKVIDNATAHALALDRNIKANRS